MSTKLKRYNVCFKKELQESLEQEALRYHMPVSRMIVFLCIRAMEYESRLEQQELPAILPAAPKKSSPREVPVFRSGTPERAVSSQKLANER